MGKKDKLIDSEKYTKKFFRNNNLYNREIEDVIEDDKEYFNSYSPNMPQMSYKETIEEENKSFDEIHNNTSISSKEDISSESLMNLDVEEFKLMQKEGEQEFNNYDTKTKARKSISYAIFKMICKKYIFKCWCGELYVYIQKQGRFIRLTEEKIKVLIRSGWQEEIQEKLSRNIVLDIIDRLLTESTFQAEGDCFNNFTHLINFLNGVLDLETGEFMRHSPKFGFTHCIQAKYDPNPKGGQTFVKFIRTATQLNKQKIDHLQEVVGYMLSEFYSAKKAPMIIGQPHSGKSTLNRIISTLIGAEHVANVPLHRLHERFILAHLSTKKVNICSELSDEALSSIEIFKAITGNDELVAEYKGKDHFTYKSKIKLLFSGNCMPVLKNQDITTAFFDRLTFINFNYTVPEEDRDYDLERKLLEEDREFIVYWAIEGIKRLMNNNFVFSESEESIKFKQKYILEQSHIKDFIKDNCILDNKYRIHLKDIYSAYLNYCCENCITPLNREKFFIEIRKEDVEKKKFRIDGSNALWGLQGITLKSK
jgi:putative DNA primase/helicase